ncbi:MAG: acetyl-CoA C-acetyltransferase [Gammaproteobacteria bacterium]|nr:acetyl-CoA C-acetyltransferase [Gammaproteobacteria bacterium]
MHEVYIAAAGRSAIGGFNGTLADLSAVEMASQVIRQLLERHAIDPALVDEVMLGHVLSAGCGQNTARQASLSAGIGITTPAMTINKVCGSGLKAVHLGAQAIALGDARLVVAGGMESMSQSAHVLPHSRQGQTMGHWQLIDTMLHDGLIDAFNGYHMGITAENLAQKYGISRQQQDGFALASQRKAVAAMSAGRFVDEIIPLRISQRKGNALIVDQDQGPRPDSSAELLARLKPAFKTDGTVTAGNASGLNDGAAVVVLCNTVMLKQLSLTPLASIRAWTSAGVDPSIMGIGPVSATRRCLSKAGWSIGDLDLIEANEAFAVQALAVSQELQWDVSRVNVNGGAIALGHPIGASGCRVLVTLLHEMVKRDVRKGLATLCIGGGQGVAIAVER